MSKICGLNECNIIPETICKQHEYIEELRDYKTYAMYDENYLGVGYFIISELDGDIVKFAKIYYN